MVAAHRYTARCTASVPTRVYRAPAAPEIAHETATCALSARMQITSLAMQLVRQGGVMSSGSQAAPCGRVAWAAEAAAALAGRPGTQQRRRAVVVTPRVVKPRELTMARQRRGLGFSP
jgi:hypothetical protein